MRHREGRWLVPGSNPGSAAPNSQALNHKATLFLSCVFLNVTTFKRPSAASERPTPQPGGLRCTPAAREMTENALEFLQHFPFQRIQTALRVILRSVMRSPLRCQPPSKEETQSQGRGSPRAGRGAQQVAPSRWPAAGCPVPRARRLRRKLPGPPSLPSLPPPHGARAHVTQAANGRAERASWSLWPPLKRRENP